MLETRNQKRIFVILIAVLFFMGSYIFAFSQEKISISPNNIRSVQTDMKQKTGEYFYDVSDPEFQVYTYKTECSGYFTVQKTLTDVIYKGYGDLASQYTYTEKIRTQKSDFIVDADTKPDTSELDLGLQSI